MLGFAFVHGLGSHSSIRTTIGLTVVRCYWARLSGTDGFDSIIDNGNT